MVLDDVDKIKKEIKDELSKYPSELSYYFADDTIKLKYDNLAIKAIQEEKIQNGETSFTIDSQDPKVKERASKLYYEDMLENKKEFNNEVYAFGFQGLSNRNNDINNFVEDSEVIDFDLNSAIIEENIKKSEEDLLIESLDKAEKVKEEENIKKTQEKINSYQEQIKKIRGKGILSNDDVLLIQSLEDKISSESSMLINIVDIEDRAPFVWYDPEAEAETGQPKPRKLNAEQQRKSDILEKLNLFDVDGNFLKTLPITQQKVIQKYFYDLKKGKIPQYGNVESILKSHEIATRMAADFSEKIKLSSSGNNQGLSFRFVSSFK